MKKILFAMAAFFGCITVSQAQTSFIATLQHESEFTHYYGAGALKSAYSAAAEGDIITLSPGTFTWPGISFDKGVTLRGAGVESSEKTFISGDIYFASTSETRETTVEGIRFNNTVYIKNDASGSGQGTIKFIKNIINSLRSTKAGTYSSDKGPAVRLYNNAIYGLYFEGNTHPDFLFYNCYVMSPYSDQYNFSETTTAFVNCVIEWNTERSKYAYYLNFYNCIFNWTCVYYAGDNIDFLLPNTATCYNCLSINKNKLFSNLVSGGNNSVATKASDVFLTYRAGHIEGENFALTETAKATYIGTDGTQIGMQGGNYPYNTTVQYPVITTFSSDPQTDKTGSLNIEVKVDGK